ncbi:MAG TPA: hypothetical protein DCX32_02775 [Candidatus Moranbacteria bacterium]|nr:MAG: hypothetical protein UW95_C0004G0047 [Parcubacteria group bacterium GW2011_GWC1_45_14]HAV11443.1 hypothetical protein [Candidatus Moranbacteria bacterium]
MDLNLWAILVAALANLIIGSLWYSPLMFGNMWMRLMGIDPRDSSGMKKGAAKAMFFSFLGALVMAYVMALVVSFSGVTSLLNAIEVAFWLWLGFVAVTSISSVLYEKKRVEIYILSVIYYLIAMIAMVIIITLWRP